MKLGGWMQLGLGQCQFMFVRGIPRVKGHIKFQLAPIGSKLVTRNEDVTGV